MNTKSNQKITTIKPPAIKSTPKSDGSTVDYKHIVGKPHFIFKKRIDALREGINVS